MSVIEACNPHFWWYIAVGYKKENSYICHRSVFFDNLIYRSVIFLWTFEGEWAHIWLYLLSLSICVSITLNYEVFFSHMWISQMACFSFISIITSLPSMLVHIKTRIRTFWTIKNMQHIQFNSELNFTFKC